VKRKVEAVLEEALVRRGRSVAARQGKRFDEVLEEALAAHLKRRSKTHASRVAETAGSMTLSRRKIDRILRDEPGLLETAVPTDLR
jgi:hypothetical protein